MPIFNGLTENRLYENRLNLSSAKLQKEQDDQKLKQDIYQAYNAALVALEKLNASKNRLKPLSAHIHLPVSVMMWVCSAHST